MIYRLAADAVVIFHFCFVAFVVTGGLIVLRWRRVAWLHLPAVAWGVYVEFSGRLCPLTPLENSLREWGGRDTYQEGFVDHYIMPVLYPEGLTHELQIWIGCAIFLINAVCYSVFLYRYQAARRRAASGAAAGGQPTPSATDAAGTLADAGDIAPRRPVSQPAEHAARA